MIRIAFIFLSFLLIISCDESDNLLHSFLDSDNLKFAEISDHVELIKSKNKNSIILKFPISEKRLYVKIPLPNGPQNWNDIGSLCFRSKSNSTIAFNIAVHNSDKERFGFNIHPYQNVPVRIAINGEYWYKNYMNNKQFKGYWISNWANHINLNEVEMLEISIRPNKPVELEIGNFTIHDNSIEDSILISGPFVDSFGQWIFQDSSKINIKKEEIFKKWSDEESELTNNFDFGYSKYCGWNLKKINGTGFFDIVNLNGRWWFVDPGGNLFFSLGMDCVRYQSATKINKRRKIFPKIGIIDEYDFYQHNVKLRYQKGHIVNKLTLKQNQLLKHESFIGNWASMQNRRLMNWGFNTIGNWSDQSLWFDPKIPFVINLNFSQTGKNWEKFPDVFSKEFADKVKISAVEQCNQFKNEELLIGYFIGNEERWPNRSFLDLIINDQENSETKKFVNHYLNKNGDSFGVRENLTELLSRKYFNTICEAIRKVDPNHLILGLRWAGGNIPDPVIKANDVFDVFSLNMYRFRPNNSLINKLHDLTGLPIIIGEFHFGTDEKGYAPSLVPVKDQYQRGVGYMYYVEQAASMPMIVGTHYFQYLDQPVTGRFDGENYLFGFLSQQDIPYRHMINFARETHKRIYLIHQGEISPSELLPLAH